MRGDAVIEELWRVKDEHSARYGHDVRVMARALRQDQEREGRKVVSLPPRRIPVADGNSR